MFATPEKRAKQMHLPLPFATGALVTAGLSSSESSAPKKLDIIVV